MNALSLGVIGGADGPTAVFVTSAVSTEFVILCVAAVIAVVVLAVAIIKRRKK